MLCPQSPANDVRQPKECWHDEQHVDCREGRGLGITRLAVSTASSEACFQRGGPACRDIIAKRPKRKNNSNAAWTCNASRTALGQRGGHQGATAGRSITTQPSAQACRPLQHSCLTLVRGYCIGQAWLWAALQSSRGGCSWWHCPSPQSLAAAPRRSRQPWRDCQPANLRERSMWSP
jgi:hypothetical protein